MGEVRQHPKARGPELTPPARFDPSIHDVKGFDCGKEPLNDWLRNVATKSEGVTARTYVACEASRVIGYYCISAGSIEPATLPLRKKHGLPKSVPVAIIGRLARDLSYRGKGLGGDLLSDALRRILVASETIGVRGVIVHVLDADSIPFYKEFDFMSCKIGDRTLFLPIETIRTALS